MKKQKDSLWKVLKTLGGKFVLAIVLSIVLLGVAFSYMGYMLYQSTRAELELQGEMDVIQSTDRLNSYLLVDKNTLLIAANAVNNLLLNKADNEEILNYMTLQSDRMINTVDKNFTGLYGWINGEYLDGVGWVPDEDYVATARPWYKMAISHPREIVFVDPYIDKQTGEVIMTIAQLLDDGKSVIALDVGLEGVQEITEDIAANSASEQVMVLDTSNVAIAHSIWSEVGNNYTLEKETLGGQIVKNMDPNMDSNFQLEYDGHSFMVYTKTIEGGWHCISVVDMEEFYRPLIYVIVVTVALGILAILLVLVIFVQLGRRELSNRNLHIQIMTAADIYENLLDIHLTDDTYYEIRMNEEDMDSSIQHTGAQNMMNERVEALVEEGTKAYLLRFLDLSTLNERLADKDTVLMEYVKENKWTRGRFICAERLPDGTVTRVLFGTEPIDEEKRQRERLRHMAETDLMTGILNRVTGEFRVAELLGSGTGGMFVLFDIDHFKQFNDNYGHNVGDQVIIIVANCLKNAFRGDDIVMRLGGDEFVAFAHGVKTRESGERILNRFYDYLGNSVIPDEKDISIFVSAGVAFSPDEKTTTFHELYEAADQCMYESKKSDGNKVTYHEDLKDPQQ